MKNLQLKLQKLKDELELADSIVKKLYHNNEYMNLFFNLSNELLVMNYCHNNG